MVLFLVVVLAAHFEEPEVDVLHFAGFRVHRPVDIATVVRECLLGIDMMTAAGPLDSRNCSRRFRENREG
jgi:hypothetical protein